MKDIKNLVNMINANNWDYFVSNHLPGDYVFYFEGWDDEVKYVEIADTVNDWEAVVSFEKKGDVTVENILSLIKDFEQLQKRNRNCGGNKGGFKMKETQRELLRKKWLDFDDYKENDYREVFNHEALYLDDIYRNGAHFNDIQFDDTIKELNYDTYEVIAKIIDDIEEVGLDYVSMLGLGMSIEEWRTFIKENREDQK